tara:strand:+ start:628 stop:870 length:243 start_codon:yes stop_codon:yes gene_type:complete
MKRPTTPLPPSSSGGVIPLYTDIFQIIYDLCVETMLIEEELQLNYKEQLELQIEYRLEMIEYWEEVYLILYGKRLYESIL